MNARFYAFQSDQYQIDTELYQGPLDVLLELIEKAELDITVLSLAQVTDQFLEYTKRMEEDNPGQVSAFIVIAARLFQIKSAALLPQTKHGITELDEDVGETLAQQLIQYRRVKQLAQWLDQRADINFRTYERINPPDLGIETPLDLSNLTIEHLALLASRLFAKKPEKAALSTMMALPRITIGQKIKALIQKIQSKGRTSFRAMLTQSSKIEAVVTFLAMLELIKRNVVEVTQDDLFADIEILSANHPIEAETFSSEFGE